MKSTDRKGLKGTKNWKEPRLILRGPAWVTGGMEMPVNNRRQSRDSGWEGEVSNSIRDEFHPRILQFSRGDVRPAV